MIDHNDLLRQLRDAKSSRTSTYLNVKRIEEMYRQGISRINKIMANEELGPEFLAGLAGILQVKLSAKTGLSFEYEISPDDKALLIELFEQKAGRLYSVDEDAPNGALMHYLGEGRITNDRDEVTSDTSLLPPDVASIVQKRRMQQAGGSKMGTIVWTSKQKKCLAAIAYLESVVDIGHIYSYPHGRYGILSRKESESSNLLFLSPIWVWFDQQTP